MVALEIFEESAESVFSKEAAELLSPWVRQCREALGVAVVERLTLKGHRETIAHWQRAAIMAASSSSPLPSWLARAAWRPPEVLFAVSMATGAHLGRQLITRPGRVNRDGGPRTWYYQQGT